MLKGIITVLSILSMTVASAQSNVEQEFKQKLESVSGKNKTIESDFTQTKKVKNIKQPVESKGQFFYDNSGRMALIYAQPAGDMIVMDGDSFTIVVSGKKIAGDASSNPIMTQISNMMQACMSGEVSKLGRGWSMSVVSATDGYKVRLTPTDKRLQKYISAMIMNFDNSNLTLDILRIEETSGGYTEYRFMNKKLNQAIDQSHFNAQ